MPVTADVALRFQNDAADAVVRRRRRGAARDLAPWVLEVQIAGQERYAFWPTRRAAVTAAHQVLGHLAAAAAAEQRAVAELAEAAAVIEADAFA